MAEIKKYKIIRAKDFAVLEVLVNDGIKQGWQPLGGPCVKEKEENNHHVFQAMVSDKVTVVPLA